MDQPSGGARFVEAGPEDAGQRIDNFLMRLLKGVPKTRIYKALRKGEVRVNKGRVKPEYKLQVGDSVRIPPVRTAEPDRPSDQQGLSGALVRQLKDSVILEDDRLLVLDKPAGMAVHGGSGISLGVIEAMRAMRPELRYLELAHRLDRETSGCLVLAKKRSALRTLHEALREGRVEKRYMAVLAGRLPEDKVVVDAPLDVRTRKGGERHVVVSEAGKHALTTFHLSARMKGATLVEVEIETGRTHQIRVHAAHLGLPVAGDERYDGPQRIGRISVPRLCLHAHSLRLPHPEDGEELLLHAPLPDDLRSFVHELEAKR